MSYRILLEAEACSTCGHCEDLMDRYPWDPTYNYGAMFKEAGIDGFNGKVARDCAPVLRAALIDMEANPAKYIAHNDPGGFGVYGLALLTMLREILTKMEQHPSAKVIWT